MHFPRDYLTRFSSYRPPGQAESRSRSANLPAATSLARLLLKQERIAEAREVPAPVYNWFTEGFDTADLKDAKAMLEELNRPAI